MAARAQAAVRGRLGEARVFSWADIRTVLGIYVLSRLLVLVTAGATAALTPSSVTAAQSLANYDGAWYLSVAVFGYSRGIVDILGIDGWTNIPFFPAYPLIIRGVGMLTGLAALPAALATSHIAGAASAWLLWLYARNATDQKTATAAVALYCFFPGAVVLSMVYPEGLAVAFAAGCLYALRQQRWVLAGLLAAAATATRSQAIVLIACCGVASLEAIWRQRDWRSLAAPLMAPIGVIAFFAYLWRHTGDPLIWLKAIGTWGTHMGLGRGFVRPFEQITDHSYGPFMAPLGLLGIAFVVTALVAEHRYRLLTLVDRVYVAAVLIQIFVLTEMGPQPRYLLLLFPLFVPLVQLLRRHLERWLLWSGAIALVTTFLYVGVAALP